MKFTSINQVQYLCFEGGGGKGITYLGVIEALELLLPKNINKEGQVIKALEKGDDPLSSGWGEGKNQIIGISGASAGSITAFLVAMGKKSKEIQQVLEKTFSVKEGEKVKQISEFEKFFDYPMTVELDNNVTTKFRIINYGGDGDFTSPTTNFYPGYLRPYTKVVKDIYIDLLYNFIENDYARNNIGLIDASKLSQIQANIIYKRFFEYFEKNPKQGTTIPSFPPVSVDYPLLSLTKKNKAQSQVFLSNLFYGSGLFLGYYIRDFYTKLMNDFLQNPLIKDRYKAKFPNKKAVAETLSFKEFFFLTGVDLRLTATNIAKKSSDIFSYKDTPSFPVVEAVAISMNIPVLFKPVLCSHVNTPDVFTHIYVDGGMLNNYPLHVFDETHQTTEDPPRKYTLFNNKILGFNLKEGRETDTQSIVKGLGIIDQIGPMINTLMSPAEDFQIKSQDEIDQTIYIYSHDLDMLNFNPTAQQKYGKSYPSKYDGPIPDAHRKTLKYFDEESLSKY